MNTNTINIQLLALLGDAIYSLYVREELLKHNVLNMASFQSKMTKYVSAKGQVEELNKLIEKNILTEEELEVVKRGRNNKKESHPKNTNIITYKLSTGFEALLGSLYIDNIERLKEILSKIEVK